MLVAFDSDTLTAFLRANSGRETPTGNDLGAFRLFMYAPTVTVVPMVAAEANRIPGDDKRWEHLKWVWYHFEEAQIGSASEKVDARVLELVPHHPEHDADDCRVIAEAEAAGAAILATIDKKIKRLQSHTNVRLLTPEDSVVALKISPGAAPSRWPFDGHPLAAGAWRI